jgi:predicted nucleic acid-binding protein
MISAVDSSVILDVLADSREFAAGSIAALQQAATQGRLIVCECVCAEVYPAIGDPDRFTEFLLEWQLQFVESTEETALRAGRMFASYLKRARGRGRVIADFLIAAHASVHADRLIARDRGYFRDYFRELSIVDPSKQPPSQGSVLRGGSR